MVGTECLFPLGERAYEPIIITLEPFIDCHPHGCKDRDLIVPFTQPLAGEKGLSILNPPLPWGPSSFSMDRDPPQGQQGLIDTTSSTTTTTQTGYTTTVIKKRSTTTSRIGEKKRNRKEKQGASRVYIRTDEIENENEWPQDEKTAK